MIATQLRINGIATCRLRTGEIGVDLFAGGGGFSDGYRRAVGISPTEAINHCDHAIRMHTANHPDSRHHRECVWKARPLEIVQGRPVGHLHASPDCTYHSQARGGKPMRDRYIRMLPWAIVRWMAATRARVVTMENVREIEQWGPLKLLRDKKGRPILDKKGRKQWVPVKSKRGQTYREFIQRIRDLGYDVEWRQLNAADYGAPTKRKRWYLIARCDGEAIVWPKPTHGPGRKPYRTAAECIDFSIPCPTIFMTKAEAKAYTKATGIRLKRPLAEKTMRRIAIGVWRFVVEAALAAERGEGPGPFILRLGQQGGNGSYTQSANRPLTTVTTKNEHCLVAPVFAQINHGSDAKTREENRVGDLRVPLGTITGSRGQAVVAAYLAKHNGKTLGQDAREPLHTVTGTDTKAMVAVHLSKAHGHGWDKEPGRSVDQPLGTIIGKNEDSVVAAVLVPRYGERDGQRSRAMRVDQPAPTIVPTGNGASLVAAFLTKFNKSAGTIGQDAREPLHTITGISRFGVVTVMIEGEEWAIVDIGMRMFTPRELARCQGFWDDYLLIGSNRDQVERIGNSVCPDVAAAIVAANLDAVKEPKRRRKVAA